MCKAEYLSTDEAATALSTTPMAILMLLRRGGLSGMEVAEGVWQIERNSLEQLLSSRPNDAPLIECRSGCASKAGGCAACGTAAE
jgi:hypothetical protein